MVTLDRPKANAVDAATSRELYQAFLRLRDDEQLRAGVVTGAGDRFFSAGWDLKAAASGEPADADWGEGGFAGLTEFFDIGKPVVAAVNGLAIGGGFELALAADLVVAAEGAEFALPEATLGLVADSGGMLRLPSRLPRVIAREMLLTGRRMTAREAAGWGLVNQVVSAAELADAALALAERACAGAPLSVAATLEVLAATEGLPPRTGFAAMRAESLRDYPRVAGSADAQEGARAFVEGRNPCWQGS
ncbi:MAG: enoyl-CoA hydratase-related protein [Nocardioidaceae bacterium]